MVWVARFALLVGEGRVGLSTYLCMVLVVCESLRLRRVDCSLFVKVGGVVGRGFFCRLCSVMLMDLFAMS